MDLIPMLTFITGGAITQLAVIALLVLFAHREARWSYLTITFLSCVAAVLLIKLPFMTGQPLAYTYPLGRLATAVPALLWLLSFVYFKDGERVPWCMWALLASYWILRAFRPLVNTEDNLLLYALTHAYPLIAMFLLIAHAFWIAIRGHTEDLVEQRRNIRKYFVIGFGLIYLSIIINRPTIRDLLNITLETIIPDILIALSTVILASLAVCNFSRLDIGSTTVTTGTKATGESNGRREQISTRESRKEKIDQKEISAILKSMEDDQLYRDYNISVGKLADNLNIPEYQLRRLVNQSLGYRNFGQFINSYRLQEAEELLTQTDLPVSTIALEVGYQSLSTFYRTFKAVNGVAPMEYRASETAFNKRTGTD